MPKRSLLTAPKAKVKLKLNILLGSASSTQMASGKRFWQKLLAEVKADDHR